MQNMIQIYTKTYQIPSFFKIFPEEHVPNPLAKRMIILYTSSMNKDCYCYYYCYYYFLLLIVIYELCGLLCLCYMYSMIVNMYLIFVHMYVRLVAI